MVDFYREMIYGSFVWDIEKESINIKKHGVDFETAVLAFEDENRKIYLDPRHAKEEERFFCIAMVEGKILTVRFTYRQDKIRIIGAGYWRKGRCYYEKKND